MSGATDGFADVASFLAAREPEADARRGALARGELVGGWRVMTLLGRGLSAEVYRVLHQSTGREGALKLLVSDAPGIPERFAAECLALKRLTLPSLPAVYDDGDLRGRPYYVMEFLTPLELPLDRRTLPALMTKIARAVGELHRAGFVHRDLKPANILLRRDGSPVIVDLGLLKRLAPAAPTRPAENSVSRIGGRPLGVGTVGFAAPEQLIQGVATVESDVFALGKILRAALPDEGGDRWMNVVRIATSDNPSDRYPTAEAFARAVSEADRGGRGRALRAALAAAALIAAAALAAVVLPRFGRAARAARYDREAEAYFYGRGVETNRVEAVHLYRKAAELGNPDAAASLARCLLRGTGCGKDPAEAVAWYGRAAEMENVYAQDGLAFCYLNGIGVPRDEKTGFEWARKAAEKGFPASECMVGECFLSGRGVEKDDEKALFWLQSAVRHGNRRAKLLISGFFEPR